MVACPTHAAHCEKPFCITVALDVHSVLRRYVHSGYNDDLKRLWGIAASDSNRICTCDHGIDKAGP